MGGHASGALEHRVHNLAQRRVCMGLREKKRLSEWVEGIRKECTNHHGHLLDCVARGHGIGALLNEVGSMEPNDMDAQDLTGFLLVEDLRSSRQR